ncbi:hypothetical protein PG997_008888 [Apiospora hydei]|uniref:Uncharacterized protein n=1 Tax=Apiospora hydei TaxID=1337664 RepID=A0ABR1WC33_9PEZI
MGFDTARDAASTTSSPTAHFTPATSANDDDDIHDHSSPPSMHGDDAWDGPYVPAVPWPGNTYTIVERGTGRPIIRRVDGEIILGSGYKTYAPGPNIQWLCVESNNHFGFQTPYTGCYLGHDGKERMHAAATALKGWEFIVARPHPKGGYQLLSPYWSNCMKLFVVGDDGKSLVRRMHGTTLFEFKKI